MSYKDGKWHENYDIFEAEDGTYFGQEHMFDKVGPARQTLDWMQPVPYGDPVKQVSNRGGVLVPALLGGAAAYMAGEEQMLGSAESGIEKGVEKFIQPIIDNPTYRKYWNDPIISFLENKSNSVPMEGPMRFAGRGVAPEVINGSAYDDGSSWKTAPPSAGPQGPLMMSPGPSIRNDDHERFMQSGPAIKEWYRKETESQNGGPRRSAVPRADNRSEWAKWKDSFTDGFAAK